MLRQAQHEDSYEDSVEKGVLILSLSKDEWPRWRRRAGSWAKPRPGSARDTIGRSVMRLQQSSLGSRALATRSRLAQTWGDPAKETFHDDGATDVLDRSGDASPALRTRRKKVKQLA